MPAPKRPAVNAAGRSIDLDAARAARAEAAGEPVTLTFHGETFTLPPELPADFAFFGEEGRLRDAVAVLFGSQAEAFFALSPSMGDIEALVEGAFAAYGVTEGESAASDTP